MYVSYFRTNDIKWQIHIFCVHIQFMCVYLINVKTTPTTTSSTIQSADHSMSIQPWLVADTYQVRTQRDTNSLRKEIKMSRIRYTWYQRPGTTNHPYHLGTDATFFLPRTQPLTKNLLLIHTSKYNIPPPSISIILWHFVIWLMIFVCLHLVQLLMCILDFLFMWGCC